SDFWLEASRLGQMVQVETVIFECLPNPKVRRTPRVFRLEKLSWTNGPSQRRYLGQVVQVKVRRTPTVFPPGACLGQTVALKSRSLSNPLCFGAHTSDLWTASSDFFLGAATGGSETPSAAYWKVRRRPSRR